MKGVTKTIDVRGQPCACHHRAIFRAFERLRVGEALKVVAARNPTPLWYRFELAWTGEYRWTWLSREPGAWRVRIERRAFNGQEAPHFHVLPSNPGCPSLRRHTAPPHYSTA